MKRTNNALAFLGLISVGFSREALLNGSRREESLHDDQPRSLQHDSSEKAARTKWNSDTDQLPWLRFWGQRAEVFGDEDHWDAKKPEYRSD
jgi:hypothetical protein